MRWMNLEPIIQSEVSQEEKDKYHVLTHIYGIQKNGTEELGQQGETDIQDRRIDMGRGEESMRRMERVTWKLTLPYVNGQPTGICCMSQETQTEVLYKPKGVEWGGRWERGSKGRSYMYTYG